MGYPYPRSFVCFISLSLYFFISFCLRRPVLCCALTLADFAPCLFSMIIYDGFDCISLIGWLVDSLGPVEEEEEDDEEEDGERNIE